MLLNLRVSPAIKSSGLDLIQNLPAQLGKGQVLCCLYCALEGAGPHCNWHGLPLASLQRTQTHSISLEMQHASIGCAWLNMLKLTDEFQLRSRTGGIRPAMMSGSILAYSWPRSDRGGSPPSLPTLLYSLSPCRVSQIFLGRPLALHTCTVAAHRCSALALAPQGLSKTKICKHVSEYLK